MRINRITLGTSSSYLICQSGRCILIDAGNSHKEKRALLELKRAGIKPEQIELIIITHVHFDHVGSLKAMKEICSCPVVVHKAEVDILKSGKVVLPRGTGPFSESISQLGQKAMALYPSLFHFEPVNPEITISEEMMLDDFGIKGRILITPGHSAGSLSVLLSDGNAFAGDLAVNYLPLNMGPIFPPFADDANLLLESWKKLLTLGATRIFPGHGRPFPASVLKEKYMRLLKTRSNQFKRLH